MPDSDHESFNQALSTVTRATVALLELYVLRRIGRNELAQIATDLAKQDSSGC